MLNLTDLFLCFAVYAGLSLTETPSLENTRVKIDECEEKLKVIIQRQRKKPARANRC